MGASSAQVASLPVSASCAAGRAAVHGAGPSGRRSLGDGREHGEATAEVELIGGRAARHPEVPGGPVGRVTRPVGGVRPPLVDEAQDEALLVLQGGDALLQPLGCGTQATCVELCPLEVAAEPELRRAHAQEVVDGRALRHQPDDQPDATPDTHERSSRSRPAHLGTRDRVEWGSTLTVQGSNWRSQGE